MRSLSLFLIFLTSAAYAQTASTNGLLRTDLISPSPTAANLQKYGDVPVTYYTGLANVSIPIFNVTGNELSLPITLTYNYSGYKAKEAASWVGLGWSLQAGGVITRTPGDKLDDHSPYPYDKDSVSRVNPTQTYLYKSALYYDNQPDVYNFNFGNYSGKFILYKNQFYLMPYQKLKIEGGPSGFTIATEDGTKYFFDAQEHTAPKATSSGVYNLPTYVSSWYLTKITNAAGTESIKLEYEPAGWLVQNGMAGQSYNKWVGNTGPLSYNFNQPQRESPSAVSMGFPTKVEVVQLSRIVSNKYVVNFIPTTESRHDIQLTSGFGSKALKSILVTSNTLEAVGSWELVYANFDSDPIKLTSLINRGNTSGEFQKHTFEYYTGSNVGWGGFDHFGYGTPGPDMLMSSEFCDEGVDREPKFGASIERALSKITYPTGGSTTFTYENTRYFTTDSLKVKPHYPAAYASRNTTNINQILISDTTVFDIDSTQWVRIHWARTPTDPPPPDLEKAQNRSIDIEIRRLAPLHNDDGDTIAYTDGSVVYEGKITMNNQNIGRDDSISLPPSRYQIKIMADIDDASVWGYVRYREFTNIPNDGKLGPGIRLKELTHDNGFGSTISKRYTYLDEQGFQSGILLQSSFYDVKTLTKSYRDAQSFYSEMATNIYWAYSSVLAETNGIGLPLYHRRVVEETVSPSGSEVLKSVYHYKNFSNFLGVELEKKQDYVQAGTSFVKQAESVNSFSSEILDWSFTCLRAYISILNIAVNGSGEFMGVPIPGGGELPPVYDKEFFFHQGKWKYNTASRQTSYEKGQSQVTENKSYYDLATRNLTATKTITSDGTSYYTRYKYPEDYTSSVSSDLITAHMLSMPLEEQVWRKNPAGDSAMVSGKITEYTSRRVSSILMLESSSGVTSLDSETKTGTKFNTLVSDSRYKKKIEFKYDAAGRVISQQLTDDMITSYLWGYPANAESGSGNTYPIAEIKNAKPDSVFYTSFEDNTGSTGASITGTKSRSTNFTISGSFAGSYKLTYWKKIGSGAWQLIQQTLSSPSNYVITVSGAVIDEVRLCPTKAMVTTYTYGAGQISATNDANNIISYYEYDRVGRLKTIKDKSGNILKNFKYHVKDEVLSSAVE